MRRKRGSRLKGMKDDEEEYRVYADGNDKRYVIFRMR